MLLAVGFLLQKIEDAAGVVHSPAAIGYESSFPEKSS